MRKKRSSYSAAGVDIDKKAAALKAAGKMVLSTATPGSLNIIGGFGGMFTAPGRNHVLVASTDGVGTKLKVANLARRHDTVGQDLVNHCVNDILVHGAKPLFFLDYFASARFEGRTFQAVLAGLCKACRENKCTLLGGETAEMPGLYPPGEYDLAGTIVGAVDRRKLITGKSIRPKDILVGLPSTGLHTNGYSLARKIIFEQERLRINDKLPGTGRSVGDVLLAVHRSYLKPVQTVFAKVAIRGIAHITGGGFSDNISRILPKSVNAVIDRSAWPVPPLFRFLQERGAVERDEMYRVFNMGIGMVLIVRAADLRKTMAILKRVAGMPRQIGWLEKGSAEVNLIN